MTFMVVVLSILCLIILPIRQNTHFVGFSIIITIRSLLLMSNDAVISTNFILPAVWYSFMYILASDFRNVYYFNCCILNAGSFTILLIISITVYSIV